MDALLRNRGRNTNDTSRNDRQARGALSRLSGKEEKTEYQRSVVDRRRPNGAVRDWLCSQSFRQLLQAVGPTKEKIISSRFSHGLRQHAKRRGVHAALTFVMAVGLLGFGSMGTAHAAPNHQVPFECDVTVTAVTFDYHKPLNAVDFQKGGITGMPVLASAAGTVTRVGNAENEPPPSYGRFIEIDHGGGNHTLYAHLSTQQVTKGQRIGQGTRIGTAGSTGGVDPHLHYEQIQDGTAVKVVLDGVPVPYYDHTNFTSKNKCDGEEPEPPQEKKETKLAYTGAESVSNGSPAELSAKLTDGDGKAVAKREVTFALGAGDSAQRCEEDAGADGVASCTITSVQQPLDADTIPLTVEFAGDDEYKSAKISAKVKLQSLSGRMYGLSADIPVLGLPISIKPTPDTGEVQKTKAPTCTQSVNALLLSADVMCAGVTTESEPARVTATASVAETSVGLPGLPVLGVSGVKSVSTSTCEGQEGGVDLTLTVAGTPVDISDAIPNQHVGLDVAGAKLVVNEQIEDDKGGLTVNALHLTAPGGVDITIASSTSTARNCG